MASKKWPYTTADILGWHFTPAEITALKLLLKKEEAMSDKVKPRQQRTPKKNVPHVQTYQPPRRVSVPDEETEHGWNVGHTANEEWR